jgi:hypothetical protein
MVGICAWAMIFKDGQLGGLIFWLCTYGEFSPSTSDKEDRESFELI